MFRRALVVGVRQVDLKEGGATIEQAMLDLGQNTGNMMFTQSLLTFIDGAKWGSFGLSAEEIDGHDAIVLAAANWVNDFDDFGWLAERLERTKLPVFLVGVGAQAVNSQQIPRITEGTLRLLQLVQDRSESISARGNFSCEVLEHYGIKKVQATGCPSLLLLGPSGPAASIEQSPTFDRCCMHATRHGFRQADSFQRFLYSQAFRRRIDLVLQSETADIHYVMHRTTRESIPPEAQEAVVAAYAADTAADVVSFLERQGRVFTRYDSWIDYMKGRSFCFGTRIHGTIAALIAGIPATLIIHDSRTAEMAEIMGVPKKDSKAIPVDRDLNIASLFSGEQMSAFKANFERYYRKFLDYMAKNSLNVPNNLQVLEAVVADR